MPTNTNVIATWVTILSIVIGGSVWVGAIANDVQNTKDTVSSNTAQIDKLRNEGPPAIARLETQMGAIQDDVKEIKKSQDELLKEIRKK